MDKPRPPAAPVVPDADPNGLLRSGLDVLGVGFAIFDRDLRLVTCNEVFGELRAYPAAMCRPGTEIAALIRFNAERGDYGPGDVEAHVASRLDRIRQFEPAQLEYELPTGRILNVRYEPIGTEGLLLSYTDVTKRRRAEQALEESDARYKLVEQAATEGIYEWFIEEGRLIASPRMEEIFGFEAGEVGPRGWDWDNRVHPDDLPRYKTALEEHFENRSDHYQCEYRFRDKAGRYRWIRDRGVCVRNANGRASRLVGAISDITHHKEIEAALLDSEERYAIAVDATSEGLYDWNIGTGEIHYSKRVHVALGLLPNELKTADDWMARIHPEDRKLWRDALVAHFKGQTDRFECEYRYRSNDGGWEWARQHGIALKDASGRAYRMVGSTGNITELKQKEIELAKKTAILENTLENMDQGISMVDGDLKVIAFNQTFLELLGFPPERFKLGYHMEEAFRYNAERGEYGPGDVEQQVQERLELSRRFEAHHFERVRPDGMVIEIHGTPLADKGGFVTTYTDITARKQAQEELRRQNERLREEIDAHRRSKATIEYLVDEIKSGHNFEEIVGESEPLRAVLNQLERVAATDSTVLLQGETGTGKELFVRAIHGLSTRKKKPLVKVNCAALPRELIESELFGHEKGAFTGATQQRKGRFELADKGSIFLDEVGELTLEAQAKLLRVLQEHEFERVGGTRTISADVRVIAATNRDLATEVDNGRFRSDLFYRLSVFPLTVPPLRERRTDIPLLARHFQERFARRLGKPFEGVDPAFLEQMTHYSWPGNVRELENVIERAAILSPGPLIESVGALDGEAGERFGRQTESGPGLRTLEDIERAHIVGALENAGWKIEGSQGAARMLDLNPSTLRGRMRKLGIKKPR